MISNDNKINLMIPAGTPQESQDKDYKKIDINMDGCVWLVLAKVKAKTSKQEAITAPTYDEEKNNAIETAISGMLAGCSSYDEELKIIDGFISGARMGDPVYTFLITTKAQLTNFAPSKDLQKKMDTDQKNMEKNKKGSKKYKAAEKAYKADLDALAQQKSVWAHGVANDCNIQNLSFDDIKSTYKKLDDAHLKDLESLSDFGKLVVKG